MITTIRITPVNKPFRGVTEVSPNDSGIIVVNKPKGISSHQAVNVVRRITRVKRVGHAGTLDPLASGVLVIGIGREATKTLGSSSFEDKEYLAVITLGISTQTDDAASLDVKAEVSEIKPSKYEVLQALSGFLGEIDQVPPQYSALKLKGKPSYKYARAGIFVEQKPRRVRIDSIELIDYEYPLLKLKVVCGKGVYIRSLARDLGEILGCGAYLSDLVRTRVGKYTIEEAKEIAN